ncbi:hypothetical protein EVA_19980 [gut metagenome]|uniref:Uncharacterized protein n=1 Tax=gut metagenome TaxID=749906 RepID=J9FX15_9ZZZZ
MLLHCAQSGSTKPTESEYAVTLLNSTGVHHSKSEHAVTVLMNLLS